MTAAPSQAARTLLTDTSAMCGWSAQHPAGVQREKHAHVLCSFAATEHYVIMAHWPSTIKPLKLVSSARLMKALAWEPANGVRFRVFDRKRGGRGLVATFRRAASL